VLKRASGGTAFNSLTGEVLTSQSTCVQSCPFCHALRAIVSLWGRSYSLTLPSLYLCAPDKIGPVPFNDSARFQTVGLDFAIPFVRLREFLAACAVNDLCGLGGG
jgi:hypothetical protein